MLNHSTMMAGKNAKEMAGFRTKTRWTRLALFILYVEYIVSSSTHVQPHDY